MGKKTEPEEDRIFKPPESPHFQTAADSTSIRGATVLQLLIAVF
jgi:hypothetical protein